MKQVRFGKLERSLTELSSPKRFFKTKVPALRSLCATLFRDKTGKLALCFGNRGRDLLVTPHHEPNALVFVLKNAKNASNNPGVRCQTLALGHKSGTRHVSLRRKPRETVLRIIVFLKPKKCSGYRVYKNFQFAKSHLVSRVYGSLSLPFNKSSCSHPKMNHKHTRSLARKLSFEVLPKISLSSL